MSKDDEYTIDELMIVCMAREVYDEGIVMQGLTTPMATTAYYLAKATHAPNAYIYQLAGNILTNRLDALPVSMVFNEFQAMKAAMHIRSQLEVYETLFTRTNSIIEFFRPAQIDKYGNMNNSVIGEPENPKVKLPGAFGIPDAFLIYPKLLIYVPRHEKRVFVEKVDCISGLGLNKEISDEKEIIVISNLGVFLASTSTKEMEVLTIHPGVSIDELNENTSFELKITQNISETKPPTSNELKLIKEKIDPLGTRKLEMLGGKERQELLWEIMDKETAV
jgi:acyl CoA:acetate/3-ketoacid CoA transferase beta subunit